ncbi:MAG: metallophosphoesterase [Acidobacteriota bacterium]
MTWLFHPVLIAAVALGVRTLLRRGEPRHLVLASAALVAVGLMAGASVAADAFHVLRLAAYVLFVYLPVFLCLSAWGFRARGPRIAAASVVVAFIVSLVGAWAFLIEPRYLEVSRVELTSPKLDHPVRIAVVADLQTDHIGDYERRALGAVMEASPDLVLLTGDYLQVGSAQRLRLAEALRELLADLRFDAPLGVFAVGGDVEQDPDWPSIFAGTRVTPIESLSTFEAGPVTVTALPLGPSRAGIPIAPVDNFHVVFGHAPDYALTRPPAELLVAGHTHGGQVRLPFFGPILTLSRVPRSWAAGVTDLGNGSTLVVSRGIGMERGRAPRLRFLCRPEVVVIDVLPEAQTR